MIKLFKLNTTNVSIRENIKKSIYDVYIAPKNLYVINFVCESIIDTDVLFELLIYENFSKRTINIISIVDSIKINSDTKNYELLLQSPIFDFSDSFSKLVVKCHTDINIYDITINTKIKNKRNDTILLGNRILFVVQSSTIGGSEIFALDFIKNISSVINVERSDVAIIQNEGLLTDSFKNSVNNYYFIKGDINKLSKLIIKNGYTHVHFINGFDAYKIIPEIKKIVKVLLTIMVDLKYYYNNMCDMYSIINKGIKDADVVVTDSFENASLFSNINVIPVGTNIIKDNNIERDEKGILWIGAMIENKGPTAIIDIAKSLPNYNFNIVISELRNIELENRIISSVPNNVKILRLLDNDSVLKMMLSNKFLLVTSKTESMPRIIIEAMSHGMCCISTDVGDVKRVIENGVTGYISDVNNMSNIIRTVDKKTIEIISKNAKEFILKSQYVMNKMINNYSKWYYKNPYINIKEDKNNHNRIECINKETPVDSSIFKVALFCDVFGIKNFGGPSIHGVNVLEVLLNAGMDVYLFCNNPDSSYIRHPEIIYKNANHRFRELQNLIKECNVHYVLNGISYISKLNDIGIYPIIGSNIIPNSAPLHCIKHIGITDRSNDNVSKDEENWIKTIKGSFWISQSTFQEREYRRLGLSFEDDVIVIQNPVDTDIFKNRNEKRDSIIWSGKNNWTKGLNIAYNIAKNLSEYNFIFMSEDEHFSIGTDLHNIKIVRCDNMNDVSDVLQRGALFLSTSVTENNPLAVLEAMSCEIPCVGWRTSGMSEIIQDFYNGILVDKDNTEHMILEIRRLISNPSLLNILGKNARKSVLENNSFTVIGNSYNIAFKRYANIK